MLFLIAGALIPLAAALVNSVLDESAYTTGTVVGTAEGTCTITFNDRANTRHTLTDSGGRGGCSLHIGQTIDVWYQPSSPAHADDQSPSTRWIFATVFASIAIVVVAYDLRLIKSGAWSRRSS